MFSLQQKLFSLALATVSFSLTACNADKSKTVVLEQPRVEVQAEAEKPALALDDDSLGAINVGSTPQEAAQEASTMGYNITIGKLDPHCDYIRPTPKHSEKESDFWLMVEQNKVTRIDIQTPVIATASGIRVGDTEERVKAVYPGIEVQPHKYVETGHNLVYRPSGKPDYRIIFETDGKHVTEMRSGLWPSVGYVESCS